MSHQGKAKVLSKEEFKRVNDLISCRKHAKRNIAMLYLSFELGLRAMEIRDLKLRDIIDKNGSVMETVILKKTKGNKPRENFINNKKLFEALKNHIDEYKLTLEKKRIPFHLDLPLFMTQWKGKFASNGIAIIFRKFYKYAGIEGAKSHSGRRTFITSKINEGFDVKSISEIVGHSTVAMTWSYYQTNPEKLKKITGKSIF
jgi:integrase/recombinase XerD